MSKFSYFPRILKTFEGLQLYKLINNVGEYLTCRKFLNFLFAFLLL